MSFDELDPNLLETLYRLIVILRIIVQGSLNLITFEILTSLIQKNKENHSQVQQCLKQKITDHIQSFLIFCGHRGPWKLFKLLQIIRSLTCC